MKEARIPGGAEEIWISPVSSGDAEFLFQILRTTMRDYVELAYGAWDETKQRNRWFGSFNPDHHALIQVSDQSAGCIQVEPYEEFLHLGKLYVLPQFQAQGVGTRVLRWLKGMEKPIRLEVLHVNPAKALYEREGFRRIASPDDQSWLLEWCPPKQADHLK